MKIDVHIEELVLNGFPASERHAVARAVEQELVRLLATGGVPEDLALHSPMGQVDAGTFAMDSNMPPQTVGQAIARSVFGRFES